MYSANLLAYVCTLKQIIFTVTFLHRRHLMYDIFSSIWLNSDGKFLGKYTIHIECLGTPLKTNISPEIDSTGRWKLIWTCYPFSGSTDIRSFFGGGRGVTHQTNPLFVYGNSFTDSTMTFITMKNTTNLGGILLGTFFQPTNVGKSQATTLLASHPLTRPGKGGNQNSWDNNNNP